MSTLTYSDLSYQNSVYHYLRNVCRAVGTLASALVPILSTKTLVPAEANAASTLSAMAAQVEDTMPSFAAELRMLSCRV